MGRSPFRNHPTGPWVQQRVPQTICQTDPKRPRPVWSGRVAGTPTVKGSATNAEFRECCLEFLDPCDGDLGVVEAQSLQAREFFQFLQSCVRDLGIVEFQRLQALE